MDLYFAVVALLHMISITLMKDFFEGRYGSVTYFRCCTHFLDSPTSGHSSFILWRDGLPYEANQVSRNFGIEQL